jgi:O-phosphoseryl-tRNA(Sec) kinase
MTATARRARSGSSWLTTTCTCAGSALVPRLRAAGAQEPETLTLCVCSRLRSMRHELYRLARDHAAAFLQVYVACPLEEAVGRNRRRRGVQAVPEEAMRRMAAAFEPPQPERNPWEAGTVVLHPVGDCHGLLHGTEGAGGGSSAGEPQRAESAGAADAALQLNSWSSQQLDQLCGQLWQLWGAPPAQPVSEEGLAQRRAEGQAANAASALHGLDLRSRKALAEAMAGALPAQRAMLGARLNAARKQLLADARGQALRAEAGLALAELEAAFLHLCSRGASFGVGEGG